MRRIPTAFLVSLLTLSIAGLALPQRAMAQDTPPAPSMTDYLQSLWNRQGVLITILTPETTADKAAKDTPELPRTLDRFNEKNGTLTRTFGDVTALASARMTVYNAHPGPAQYEATGNSWHDQRNVIPTLLASLTAAQWRKIASSNGLALSDLSGGEQQKLWDQITPDPLVVITRPATKERTLSEDERRQIRLHVKLMTDISAPLKARKGQMPVLFHKDQSNRSYRQKEAFPMIRDSGMAYDMPGTTDDKAQYLYGQPVAWFRQNRLKPLSEVVDMAKLTASVSLAPDTEDAEKGLSVGVLLQRIGAATGTVIHVGGKVAAQKVTVVGGDRASSGGVLSALLFALRATVRALPSIEGQSGDNAPLLVLAPDTEPLARQEGRKADWYLDSQAALEGSLLDNYHRIAAQNPAPLLNFDPDEPAPLTGELRAKVFAASQPKPGKAHDGRDEAITVKLEELPAAIQTFLNNYARQSAEDVNTEEYRKGGYDFRVNVSTVGISCTPWLGIIVPGTGELSGEIDYEPLQPLSDWLPAAEQSTSVTLDKRILVVSAVDSKEATELTHAAKKAGVAEVWLDAAPDALAAAVTEAGTIPVRAVASLLKASAGTPEGLPHDENIYGSVARDNLVPGDPAVQRWVVDRVHALSAVPGIAGVVLRDIAPIGYRGASKDNSDWRATNGEYGASLGGSGAPLGYTLAYRRAFVQKFGVDPEDILSERSDISGYENQDPFGYDKQLAKTWAEWRQQQAGDLYHAVHTAIGNVPVWVEGESSFRGNLWARHETVSFFLPWPDGTAEPPIDQLFPHAPFTIPRIPEKMLTIIIGNRRTDLPATELLHRLEREDKPATTIVDLTDRSRPEVSEMLRSLRKQ